MTEEKIGAVAGLVWEYLRDSGDGGVTLSALKRIRGAQTDEILAAMGWLAREGKIAFQVDRRSRVHVRLVSAELVCMA